MRWPNWSRPPPLPAGPMQARRAPPSGCYLRLRGRERGVILPAAAPAFCRCGRPQITTPRPEGVVVVCGPNEVSRSSMLEALDLLLTCRDRSTHRDVQGGQARQRRRRLAGPGRDPAPGLTVSCIAKALPEGRHRLRTDLRGPGVSSAIRRRRPRPRRGDAFRDARRKLWEAQRVLPQSSSTGR